MASRSSGFGDACLAVPSDDPAENGEPVPSRCTAATGVAAPDEVTVSSRLAMRTMSLPRGSAGPLPPLASELTVAKLSTLSAIAGAVSVPETSSLSVSSSVRSSASLPSRVGLSAEGTKSPAPGTAFLRALMERATRARRPVAPDVASAAVLDDEGTAADNSARTLSGPSSLLLTLERDLDGGKEVFGDSDARDLLRCERRLPGLE
jgi:hypothetical protein